MKKSDSKGSTIVAPAPKDTDIAEAAETILAAGSGKPKAKGKAKDTGEAIGLSQLRKVCATVRILGDTPIIVNNFSEKAKQQIRDTQQKKAKQPRAAKEPDKDFLQSLYRLPSGDGFGIPARAIKAALVTAANDVNLMKTVIKRVVRVIPVNGDPNDVDALVKIDAPPILKPLSEFDKLYWDKLAFEHKHGCYMREDPVRLAQGQADLRYRACFPHWSATFRVMFLQHLLSVEQLYGLIEAAGMCGLCEWRPSSPQNESGQFGCFHFDREFEGLHVEIYGTGEAL